MNSLLDIGIFDLRIDNRRQSIIRATSHYSLLIRCIVSCHISNDSLYFCVSSHINDVMIIVQEQSLKRGLEMDF